MLDNIRLVVFLCGSISTNCSKQDNSPVIYSSTKVDDEDGCDTLYVDILLASPIQKKKNHRWLQ